MPSSNFRGPTRFAQRAWVTLEEKKIPYQYIEINPYRKEPSFLALNPRGLVPTLGCPTAKGESKPLYESNVICEYLEEAYPAHQPSLLPKDKYEKARMKIWIDFVTSRIIPAFHRFLQHTKNSSYNLEEARKELLDHFKTWTKEMDLEGPFWAGKEISMADIALAPWIMRLWALDHFKEGGLGIPEKGKSGEDEEVWARWREWTDAIQARKSIQETTSERQYYLAIYNRYAEDRAQSELAKAMRAGRDVP